MNTLRRILSVLALVAFAMPTIGTARSYCVSTASHDMRGVSPAAHEAMPGMATTEHCDGCDAPQSEQVPPCDHGSPAACGSTTSCASVAAAEVTMSARSGPVLAATTTYLTEQQPLSASRAPEPPPPRT